MKLLEKEKLRRKKLILDTAKKNFKQNGYTKTKMTDIADKVGIAKGTLYNYFRNKRDIFWELYYENLYAAIENIEQMDKQNIIKEENYISIISECLLHFFIEETEFFQSVFQDFNQPEFLNGFDVKKLHKIHTENIQRILKILNKYSGRKIENETMKKYSVIFLGLAKSLSMFNFDKNEIKKNETNSQIIIKIMKDVLEGRYE